MNYLSKKDSTLIRTIAILMMIYCHFFGKENGGTYFDNAFWNFYIFGHSLQGTIAIFCKLCTSIFAFISGYGLYSVFTKKDSDIVKKIKYAICKFSNLYLVYLLVLSIYIIAFKCFNIPLTNKDIVLNVFLMNRIIGPSWYIVFYYEAVLFLVVYDEILKKKYNQTIEFLIVTIIPAIFNYLVPNTRFFHFLPVLLYGYLINKYNIYEKIRNLQNYKIISLTVLVVLFLIRVYAGDEIYGITMVTFVTPTFIFILKDVLNYIPGNLINIIFGISKYSTYYWLLHCIFQCGIVELQRVAFLPYFSVLIIVWTVSLLTPISGVLETFQKKLTDLLANIVKIYKKRIFEL